jgi:D-cysteine desulfhydrase
MAEAAAVERNAGRRPFIIPYGGSNAVGAAGYAAAFLELAAQLQERDWTADAVVFATSSGGTQAGLVAGARAVHFTGQLIGVSIDKTAAEFRPALSELTAATADLLQIDAAFAPADFVVADGYLGGGYGIVGEPERAAIHLLARTEGVLLDPVYTGRAMAGLLDLIRQGRFASDESVVFWHTGGLPALFAYADML